MSQTDSASWVDVDELRANGPVVLIFAPYIDHDGYVRQKQILAAQSGKLADRGVTVIDVVGDDRVRLNDWPATAEAARPLRERFEADVDDFAIVVLSHADSPLLRHRRPITAHRLIRTLDWAE